MKKILFTHSYFMPFDPKQWETGRPYPPLGTLYAAAWLRENGFVVDLFDTMFLDDPALIGVKIEEWQPDVVVIYDDGFNYLTKMCLTNMREAAFSMNAIAKAKGCMVIVSSSDATDHAEHYLNHGADYVILGEAEHTLLELVKLPGEKESAEKIQGICFHRNGNLIRTARRSVIRELDSLPMPAWDIVDIEPYRKTWLRSSGYFSLNVVTTRGCPFKCNWCAKPIYGNRYHSRSPEKVVEELIYLKTKFGFDHIWFCDDIFGLKPGWVQAFAGLVKNAGLSFRFKIQCRADLLLQEDYIAALAMAGCENVWMGAESGSQKILDAMNKGITTAQIRSATLLLKKYGIKPSFFIQFGYPGETRKDIRQTIHMINELLPHSIGISVSYPLPGTVFYEKVKNDLKEKSNWTDSDELQLMFRNTFRPAFYKQLHRHVHYNYRMHLAGERLRKFLRHPFHASSTDLKKILSWFYYAPATFLTGIKIKKLETA